MDIVQLKYFVAVAESSSFSEAAEIMFSAQSTVSKQIASLEKELNVQLFDRTKLLAGILKATQKRPVNAEQIAQEIEAEIQNALRQDIPTRDIGEMVMTKLKEQDVVAYVRFASVYREFKDADTFLEEINKVIRGEKKEKKGKGYTKNRANFFHRRIPPVCFL